MVQTLVMVIVLLIIGAVIQTNMAVIHTQSHLMLPGDSSVPISYLRVLAGVGAAVVLVWLAGMADVALLRGRIRRRDAAMLALEQDLMRYKATGYDQQQTALNDVKGRLEGVVREFRGMVGRVEIALQRIPDRVPPEEAVVRRESTVRREAVVASSPAPAPEEPKELEEVGAQPRKRWPPLIG
jgi:hypothetical protein